jgi:hypothetical protein
MGKRRACEIALFTIPGAQLCAKIASLISVSCRNWMTKPPCIAIPALTADNRARVVSHNQPLSFGNVW